MPSQENPRIFRDDFTWKSGRHRASMFVLTPHEVAVMILTVNDSNEFTGQFLGHIVRSEGSRQWTYKITPEQTTEAYDMSQSPGVRLAAAPGLLLLALNEACAHADGKLEMVQRLGHERQAAAAHYDHDQDGVGLAGLRREISLRQASLDAFVSSWFGGRSGAPDGSVATPIVHKEVLDTELGPLILEISSVDIVRLHMPARLRSLVAGQDDPAKIDVRWDGSWAKLPDGIETQRILADVLNRVLDKHGETIDRAARCHVQNARFEIELLTEAAGLYEARIDSKRDQELASARAIG